MKGRASNAPPVVCRSTRQARRRHPTLQVKRSYFTLVSAVRAATAPDHHLFALLYGEDAETVALHLVQPVAPSRRAVGERRLARANETDWRISSPSWRGGAGARAKSKALASGARGRYRGAAREKSALEVSEPAAKARAAP